MSRWSVALLALVVGCAERGAPRDVCQEAAEHLAACGAVPSVTPDEPATGCDPALAQQVIDQSCDDLAPFLAAPKADSPLGDLACELGFYFACPVPACTAPPAPATCADLLEGDDDCGLCRYYDCREQTAQCGADAYLVGYVGRYCRRFAQVTEPRVSPAAAAWLQRVRRCLVTWLEDNVPYEASCAEIDARGTTSHAVCYVETGFCELSLTDWTAIVLTIDPGDAPFHVMLATAQGCVARWLGY